MAKRTAKAPATAPAAGNKPQTIQAQQSPGEPEAAAVARTVLRPSVLAGITLQELVKPSLGETDLSSLVAELGQQAKAVNGGDLGRMEGMLTAQAHTLDALFHRLTRQALLNIGHYPETVERYMKLALRAQSQARSTAEALNEIKHPRPVAFVQQANIANGPQQVNNQPAASRTGETEKAPNKLLGEPQNGQEFGQSWLDTGTAGAARQANPDLVPVAVVNGSKNR